MADANWLDTSADWSAAANWSTGAAPTASDGVGIRDGSQTINTSLPAATGGINYDYFQVGENFAGQIGDSTHHLYLGTCDVPLIYNGVLCRECWLATDSGDSNAIRVVGTSRTSANALHLVAGTWSAVYVESGIVRIGASATVTLLFVLGTNAQVVIESGATITTAIQRAGTVECYAAAGTIRRSGGTWHHLGQSAYNITTLDQMGGTFYFSSHGGTITTATVTGGMLDCSQGPGKPRTITTLYRLHGGTVNTGGSGGAALTITTDYAYGGSRDYETIVR